MAAALEDDFLERGVSPAEGRPGRRHRPHGRRGRRSRCDDGRVVRGQPRRAGHRLGAQQRRARRARRRASSSTPAATSPINHHCQSNVPHIYAAGDVSGKLPLSSVAAMQGRKVAEHVMGLHTVEHRHLDYDKAASAIFTEPEIADVGLAEAEAFAVGPQDPGDEGAVLRHAEGAHQQRRPRVREDRVRSDDRRGPRRIDRRPPRRRADQRASRSPSPPACGSATSSRACSSTPRSRRRWPKPPSDATLRACRLTGGEREHAEGGRWAAIRGKSVAFPPLVLIVRTPGGGSDAEGKPE